MKLFKPGTNSNHLEIDEATYYPLYQSQENEAVDFYRKYKDSDYLPTKGRKNLQNLFDDSDIKDYYWLKIARKYFSENKNSSLG